MESNELKLFMQAMRTDNPWVEINNQMIQMIAAGFKREEAFELVKLLITLGVKK